MLRDKTNVIRLREQLLGGSNPILIQTMADIKTSRTDEILAQVQDLAERGADLYRVSVLDEKDLLALPLIVKRSPLPIIADIHFSSDYAIRAIKAGVDKIRINPGNMKIEELVSIIDAAKAYNTAIRIGINSGSLDLHHQKNKHEMTNYFQSLDRYLRIFKENDYDKNLVISLKSSDPLLCLNLYQAAAELYPYPLHVGITETGFGVQGMARTMAGLVPILSEIGRAHV